jgi:hypothetical protein
VYQVKRRVVQEAAAAREHGEHGCVVRQLSRATMPPVHGDLNRAATTKKNSKKKRKQQQQQQLKSPQPNHAML